ncbi:MAG TPA: prepilin peptidase [Chthoniobacterales bacterium]
MFSTAMLVAGASLALGAAVGSFLGCLVYRWPRDLSLLRPPRSFCPACQQTLPWHRNVPILSWLLLRGRCRDCRAQISIHYLLLELLTALLFLLLALDYPLAEAVPLGVFFAVLLAATFIDVEHLIIPDRLTVPAVAAGLIASTVVPALHGAEAWSAGLWASLVGAAVGYGLLYLVSYLGKLAFGRWNLRSAEPIDFEACRTPQEGWRFRFDGESYAWKELFYRRTDRIRIQALGLVVDGRAWPGTTELILTRDAVGLPERMIPLGELEALSGTTQAAVFPREALGLGDVKLMAVIGAFLGWPGVCFSLGAGSLIGTVVGLTILVVRRTRDTQIPFGPYLSAGAVLWTLAGPRLLQWYVAHFIG